MNTTHMNTPHGLLTQQLEDGSKNAKQAQQLAQELSLDTGGTQESTRELIREAICSSKFPIGSTKNGYFLIDSQCELDSVLKNLRERINGIHDRINSLQEGWRLREESRNQGNNWPK